MDCGQKFSLEWLEKQFACAQKESASVVSGVVYLVGEGLIDTCAVAQTYGYRRNRPCVPSTLARKEVFLETGLFLEERRAGYDAEWQLALENLGIKRAINTDVVIKYMGINFAGSIKTLFRKSVVYSIPTVGMKYYKVPYYYLAFFFLFLTTVPFMPHVWPYLLFFYVLLRGYILPIYKSQTSIFFKEEPLCLLMLPIVSFVIDTGKIIGILIGFTKYHIIRHQ